MKKRILFLCATRSVRSLMASSILTENGHHAKCCVVTSSHEISTAASRRTFFFTGSDHREKWNPGLPSRSGQRTWDS